MWGEIRNQVNKTEVPRFITDAGTIKHVLWSALIASIMRERKRN